MDRFSLSLWMGIVIGAVDVIPMWIQRLPRHSTVAAFIHHFVATVVIVNTEIPQIPWWLKGGVLSFALMMPMLIHVGHTDKKPLPIIAANAIVLGSVVGIAAHYL